MHLLALGQSFHCSSWIQWGMFEGDAQLYRRRLSLSDCFRLNFGLRLVCIRVWDSIPRLPLKVGCQLHFLNLVFRIWFSENCFSKKAIDRDLNTNPTDDRDPFSICVAERRWLCSSDSISTSSSCVKASEMVIEGKDGIVCRRGFSLKDLSSTGSCSSHRLQE